MLFIDTETTGVTTADELLSIAIVALTGEVVLDSFITPMLATEWPKAQKVNGITPNFIKKGKFPLATMLPVEDLLEGNEIVFWGKHFDMRFMRPFWPSIDQVMVYCCQERFGAYKKEIAPNGAFRRWSLVDAATDCGYEWPTDKDTKAHSSLGDALATKFVWEFLDKQEGKVKQIIYKDEAGNIIPADDVIAVRLPNQISAPTSFIGGSTDSNSKTGKRLTKSKKK